MPTKKDHGGKPCEFCGEFIRYRCSSEEYKAKTHYCSTSCRQRGKWAKKPWDMRRVNSGLLNKLQTDPSLRGKLSLRGDRSPHWKADRSQVVSKRQNSTAAAVDWRRKVFERDNYTCQMCHERGGKLQADHIVPYWQVSEQFLWSLCNGRTLCVECHAQTPTYANSGKKLKKEYERLADMMSEFK